MSFRYEIPDTQMADEKQLEILQEKANFRHFKPKPFNMREFSDRAGHDIQEMLLSCFFRGEPCGPDDFKVVSCCFLHFQDMGICVYLYVCVCVCVLDGHSSWPLWWLDWTLFHTQREQI